ncbi:MAG: hypothetical protein FGM37_02425 [Phycisphaerales bacterium]|nr:hypothetical protein [Phycisphaerales bacterium]
MTLVPAHRALTGRLVAAAATLSSIALVAPLAHADEAHLDPYVWAQGGRIEIGAWDDDTNKLHEPFYRVFGAELGEDPDFPFSIDEPGIRSSLNGLTFSLDLDAGLQAWNGSAFGASTSSMSVAYGGSAIGTAGGGSLSFLVGDDFHAHPDFTLSGLGGTDPAPGIYLISFTVSSVGYGTSDRFWIAFNLGMSEADHETAIEWVEANYVPAPGALALIGVMIAGTRSRRRTAGQ